MMSLITYPVRQLPPKSIKVRSGRFIRGPGLVCLYSASAAPNLADMHSSQAVFRASGLTENATSESLFAPAASERVQNASTLL